MKQIARKHKNRQGLHFWGEAGYTLAELIVTFALLAIFMASVVMCLPKITKIYMNLQTLSHQKTICNTVSNLIRDELQVCLGVEELRDQLGTKVENENRNGYIVLLNDSGQPMPATGGGLTSPGAIKEDITGSTLEFIRQDGIVAQIDTKGYAGYTMRKKKLQKAYLGNQVISSGALLTRYYELDKQKKKISSISYSDGGDYRVSSEAGIVNKGTQNVVYALQYPFARNFYEGYDLKVDFTIKGDAFYGDGTTERNYVKYVNYTLSLLKNGDVKYAQDYVVNIQNAVPYLQEKVTPDPIVPDVPGMSGTYVVPGSVQQKGDGYTFKLHIEPSMDEAGDDTWIITFPENIILSGAYVANPGNGIYVEPVRNGNKLIISRLFKFGFRKEEVIDINFWYSPTSQDVTGIEGSDQIECFSTPYATPSTCDVRKVNYTRYNEWDSVVETSFYGIQDSAVKVYMELEYDKKVAEVKWNNDYGPYVEADGKIVKVYGYKLEKGTMFDLEICVRLEGGTKTENPVSCTIGNVPYTP